MNLSRYEGYKMDFERKTLRLIDGALATELAETYGHHNIHGDPLWSARLIATNPNDISLVHRSYLEAGCDVIETATYQASIQGLQEHLSVDHSKASSIISQGIKVCVQARDEFWEKQKCKDGLKPLVAGSIGPFGAHLADGSEYNGHYVDKLSEQELVEWHLPQVETIWRSGGIDLLAFETIPSQKEANAIVHTLKEIPDARAWITFSCQDGSRTCHGEPFRDAIELVACSDQVVGCGINCTAPWFVEPLMANIPLSLKETKTIVVYPNSGQSWMPDKSWSKLDVDQSCHLRDYVDRWIASGATWIGGCCKVTPKDIALMRTALDKHRHK